MPPSSRPALIVCHGHALEAVTQASWADIVVGNAETGRRGRLLTALARILELSAANQPTILLLGTGASNGTIATPNPTDRCQRRAADATAYKSKLSDALRNWAARMLGIQADAALKLIDDATLDASSMSTAEELHRAKAICERMDVRALELISTPEHILRCHATALDIFRATTLPISAIAAQTRFDESGSLSTVVLEGVHGAHDPDYALPAELQRHNLARGLFFGAGRSDERYRRRLADLARAS